MVKELPQRSLVKARHPLFQLSRRFPVCKPRARLAQDVLFVGVGVAAQRGQGCRQPPKVERVADCKLHFLNLSSVVVGVMHQDLEIRIEGEKASTDLNW